MADDIVVHGVIGSPFMRAALMGLEEKRLPYRVAPLGPGESKQPAHLARHPFGRVPAFQHGDFALYETQAILRYVDAIAPQPPLQPADPRAAARMNQMIGINDWYFFPQVGTTIVFQRIVGPHFLGITPDQAIIEAAMPKAKICIAELDRLLGEQRFCAGEQVSIADLLLAPQIEFFSMTPESRDLLAGTRLAAWLSRMQARESMAATTVERLRAAA